MNHETIEKYVLSMPNARLEYPFGEDVAVYKVVPKGANPDADGRGRMFALIAEGKDPVRISLKCDQPWQKFCAKSIPKSWKATT